MNSFCRRFAAVLLAVAIASMSAACSSTDSEGASKKDLTLGVQEPYAGYLLDIAMKEGYLDGSGIDGVKTTLFTDLPAMFASVQKGQIQLGMQTIPALNAFNQSTAGDKLQLVQQFGNVTRWYSRKDLADLPNGKTADWQTVVKSWKGRTIGVPAIGSFMDNWLRFMLKQVGLDPDKDVRIAVVGVQSSAAALKQGTVDIVGVTSGGAAAIEDQGVGNFALDYPSGPPEFQDVLVSVYFASAKQIKEHGKLYADVATAMEKARTFAADPANKDACIQVLVKLGLTPEIAAQVYTIDHDGIANTKLDEPTFTKTVDTLTTLGLLKDPVPTWADFVGIKSLS